MATIAHVQEALDEGVRSLSVNGPVATTGSGFGTLAFFDMRAQRYLVINERTQSLFYTTEEGMHGKAHDTSTHNQAIYTHCYDFTGTRIFAAGGPLDSKKTGTYAAIWA